MKPLIYSLSQARRDLPRRSRSDNKTTGGKTLIIAGSTGMTGAAVLSATAAARAGAGYVYLHTSGKPFSSFRHPDFLQLPVLKDMRRTAWAAVAMGPGLSPALARSAWKELRYDFSGPVVVDAEALNELARSKTSKKLSSQYVLTPHEGEMARLLQWTSARVKKNREAAVVAAQKKWGGVFVLKGPGTLIYDGNYFFKVASGNPALGKAGTGDVLTGMICAFLAQGLAPVRAAALAAFVHGFIADQWIRARKDVLSLMASDLLNQMPLALATIRRSAKK